VQYTQLFDNNFKTLEVSDKGIISLNGDEVLNINFDELSFESKNYSYKIMYCNADWRVSNLAEFEYLDGMNLVDIEDYRHSVNTFVEYTHYAFSFPNERIKPKISGNYLVQVFESGIPDNILLQARVYVLDKEANVVGKVRTNTDLGTNTKYQQIDFDVITDKNISDPFSEIKVCVQQNHRTDNEVKDIKPSFISRNKLTFSNNPKLVFEAGNEYRSLDISNLRLLDDNVKNKSFDEHYSLWLEDKSRSDKAYKFTRDINGGFIVNLQNNNYEDDVEADYIYAGFTLAAKTPFLDGNVYLTGGFNAQLLNNRMQYDNELKHYVAYQWLKQGGYNYQYLFVPRGETRGSAAKIEGSFWETENEYEVFVYYRPVGSRYDGLIGYLSVSVR
jgi:hypothetical protein